MNIKELENNLKEILTTVDFKTDDDSIVQQIIDTFNSIHNCDKSDQIKFCQYLIENENDLPLLLDKMMINTPSILVFNLIIQLINCVCYWLYDWILSNEIILHTYVYYHLPTLIYLFLNIEDENQEYLSGIHVILLAIYNLIRKSEKPIIRIPDLARASLYHSDSFSEKSSGELNTTTHKICIYKFI